MWIRNREPNLTRRYVYTFLLLLLFRLLANIPVLNVDEERMNQLLANNPLVGLVSLFAGGEVLNHFSLAAAGILPYLVALILVQAATWIVPSLRELRGQADGEERVEHYAKLLTIPLAIIFAFLLCRYLARQTGLFPGRIHWFTSATFFASLLTVGLVTAGSLASTGIIHFMTKKGVGEGKDVILLSGASLGFFSQIIRIAQESPNARTAIQRLGAIAIGGLVVLVLSIYLVQTVRRVPLQSMKRRPGAKPTGSEFAPFLLNRGRILPVTAAIGWLAIMHFGQTLLQTYSTGRLVAVDRALSNLTTPNHSGYWIALAGLTVLFVYLCNFSLIWAPYSDSKASLADWWRRTGHFVPGLKPGKDTAEYLSKMMWRISLLGALGVVLLAAGLPYAVLRFTSQNVLVTVLTIMVVVETVDRLRHFVLAKRSLENYEGFLGAGQRLRSR